MVLFVNLKHLSLLFSVLLHLALFGFGFTNIINSNFNHAIKPQAASGLNFKISLQNNIIKQVFYTKYF